jgi:hypothetical protein
MEKHHPAHVGVGGSSAQIEAVPPPRWRAGAHSSGDGPRLADPEADARKGASSAFRTNRDAPQVFSTYAGSGRSPPPRENAMNVSTFLTSCGAVLIVSGSVVPATAQLKINQTNLVSDIPGLAKLTDPDLETRGASRLVPRPRFGFLTMARGLRPCIRFPARVLPASPSLA